MKKALLIVGIILFIGAVKPATSKYRTQISQYCGEAPAGFQEEQKATWIWQWWPYRSPDVGFAACVGPEGYMSYHPVDVAAAMAVAGIGLMALGLRSKRG